VTLLARGQDFDCSRRDIPWLYQTAELYNPVSRVAKLGLNSSELPKIDEESKITEREELTAKAMERLGDGGTWPERSEALGNIRSSTS
jgi:hypothetical protein